MKRNRIKAYISYYLCWFVICSGLLTIDWMTLQAYFSIYIILGTLTIRQDGL